MASEKSRYFKVSRYYEVSIWKPVHGQVHLNKIW